jgi:hypothetical protein
MRCVTHLEAIGVLGCITHVNLANIIIAATSDLQSAT